MKLSTNKAFVNHLLSSRDAIELILDFKTGSHAKYLAIYSDHVAPSGGGGGALLCHRGVGEVPAEGGGPPCGIGGVY